MSAISWRKAHVLWDLETADPSLYKALARRAPWAARRLAGLRRRLPVARSAGVFHDADFFRLDGHHRSFCWQGPGGVLAFKGGEPAARDLPRMPRALLEHFALVEGKIPLAVTTPEALAEARLAALFQKAYWSRYRCLARAPVPLLVVAWPERARTRFLRLLGPTLSARARREVARLAQGGLGCLVYHYPGRPVRAQHAAIYAHLTGADQREVCSLLLGREAIAPREAAGRWMSLCARMLALGFFPCRISARRSGQCLSEQNAVIDGGFVDLGSLEPMSEVPAGRAFARTLELTAKELASTIRRFTRGLAASPARRRLRADPEVRRALAGLLRGEPLSDPRLSDYL